MTTALPHSAILQVRRLQETNGAMAFARLQATGMPRYGAPPLLCVPTNGSSAKWSC